MSEQFDAVPADDPDIDDGDDSALITDEDRLGEDPLEDGMDVSEEDYSRAVRFPTEFDEPEPLAYRLPQEEPDPALEEVDLDPGRPLASTPLDELDESIDDPLDPANPSAQVDPLADGATEGQLLDQQVELGLDSAAGSAEPTGLPADDESGAVASMEGMISAEGAEQQALHIEQES